MQKDASGNLVCSATTGEVAATGFSVAWTADGVSAPHVSTTNVAGDTIASDESARAADWECTVSAGGAEASAAWHLDAPVAGAYALETIGTSSYPSDILVTPDQRLLISSLLGDISLFDPATGATVGTTSIIDAGHGISTIALDPRFGDGQHDWLYMFSSSGCAFLRYDLSLEPLAVSNPLDLWAALGQPDCPTGGADGGDIVFYSPNGGTPSLYMSIGPVSGFNGQDDTDLGGGIIAFDFADDGTPTPAVPSVFATPGVAAIGMRQPWRMANCGAVLCVGDVGLNAYEELDLYTGPGNNFGFWNVEGPDSSGLYDSPTRYWDQHDPQFVDEDLDSTGRLGFVHVITLGVRASGKAYAGLLDGYLLYGEFYDGWIRGMKVNDDGTTGSDDIMLAHMPYSTGMAEAADGTIYAADLSGRIRKLGLRADRRTVGPVGLALSATTYANAGSDTSLGYTVQYPLWANGADKDREIDLPAGGTVDVSNPDAWAFPVGTRFWKTFSMDGEKVETRELEKQSDGWVAGTYKWEGPDAFLTDGRRQNLELTNTSYLIPSEFSCSVCHEATVGREWPIGFEHFQLGDTQLHELASLFSGDPGSAGTVVGTDSVYRDIRGYLHGNCAFCHQPGALPSQMSEVSLDFRYSNENFDAVTQPIKYYDDTDPFSPVSKSIISLGHPEDSYILDMLVNTDMPLLSVWRPDMVFYAELDDWIARQPAATQ